MGLKGQKDDLRVATGQDREAGVGWPGLTASLQAVPSSEPGICSTRVLSLRPQGSEETGIQGASQNSHVKAHPHICPDGATHTSFNFCL